MRQLRRIKALLRSEDGFTLAECLVAMVIFLIAICALWEVSIHAGAGFSSATKHGLTAARVSTIDRVLRMRLTEVTPPFWGDFSSTEVKSTEVSFPYYKDDLNKRLVLSYADHDLTIQEVDKSTVFHNIEAMEFDSVLNSAGSLVGIKVTYTIGLNTFSTKALFGSLSMTGTEEF
jgi:prepilin-type N-terminal cleavage/methylation domain-containing protein